MGEQRTESQDLRKKKLRASCQDGRASVSNPESKALQSTCVIQPRTFGGFWEFNQCRHRRSENQSNVEKT
jgi:hypothetical protein